VADQQHVAPGGKRGGGEGAAAEQLGDLDFDVEVLAGDPRRLLGPHLGAGEAGVELHSQRLQRLAGVRRLALSLFRQPPRRVVLCILLSVAVSE
jgi:hypothetical protein